MGLFHWIIPLPSPAGPSDGYRGPMAFPVLLCTDGSSEALGASPAGLELLGRDHDVVLVSVMDAPDEGALAGSGHAGPELSLEEYDEQVSQAREEATSALLVLRASWHWWEPKFASFRARPALRSVNLPLNCRLGQS